MKPVPYHQAIIYALLYLWLPNCFAVCDVSTPLPGIDFAYSRIDDFQAESAEPYKINGVVTQFNVDGEHWGASHEYLALDFPRDNLTTPVTNGDLHLLVIGYRDDVKYSNLYELHWEVLPTIAVSSNQFKNIEELKSSSFRLDGHLIWQARLLNNSSLFIGACSAAITGNNELIPLAGFKYQYSGWEIIAGYPHSKLEYSISPTILLFSSWALSGNQWEVLDNNLENRNEVQLQSKQIKIGLQFSILHFGSVEAYWLHYYDQEMEYLARDNSYTAVKMGSVKGWMVRFRYFF